MSLVILGKSQLMKVIAFDRFKPGVAMDTIGPVLAEEVAHAWPLWKRGIVRENYSRVDEPGVVLVFEVEHAAAAMRAARRLPNDEGGIPRMDVHPRDGGIPARSAVHGAGPGTCQDA
jgi:hypothetical protein